MSKWIFSRLFFPVPSFLQKLSVRVVSTSFRQLSSITAWLIKWTQCLSHYRLPLSKIQLSSSCPPFPPRLEWFPILQTPKTSDLGWSFLVPSCWHSWSLLLQVELIPNCASSAKYLLMTWPYHWQQCVRLHRIPFVYMVMETFGLFYLILIKFFFQKLDSEFWGDTYMRFELASIRT